MHGKTTSEAHCPFLDVILEIMVRGNQKVIWKVIWFKYFFLGKPKFLKILVLRLLQNTSNVNIESIGKSKELYYLYDQLLGF